MGVESRGVESDGSALWLALSIILGWGMPTKEMLPMSALARGMRRFGAQHLGAANLRKDFNALLGQVGQAMPPVLLRRLQRMADALPPLARLRLERRLQHQIRSAFGYEPDLRHPRTFNERVAHKILYDRDPLIPLTTDKVAVRDYVAVKVGAEILLPQFGVWNRAEDIPWDALPNSFVLKGSHGWQMNLLVHDKSALDRAAATRQAARWLSESHFERTGEWGYRGIRPRLLAEQLLVGDRPSRIPEDFKIFVFGGQPRLLEVHFDRGTDDYGFLIYDARELRPLPPLGGSWRGAAPYVLPPEAPELVDIAARLGADFDFVRVDLYLSQGKVWFGELTHYPANACARYAGVEQDLLVGDIWAGKR